VTDPLREAARRALTELEEAGEGEVTRITLDVDVAGQRELVTLAVRDGALARSTSGSDAHVAAALRWLLARDAGDEATGVRTAPASTELGTGRMSWVPEPPEDDVEQTAPRVRLADAFDEVVTTVVRAGVGSPDSPAIADGLERLRKEVPLPTSPGMSRWLGRLRQALDAEDVALVARLLDGASRLAEELRRDKPTGESRRRVVAWLGATPELGGVERVSDRTLIEIARERLATNERGGMERRYLVDTRNGEVFREERSRSNPVASVGPCPRVVHVGLAEVERGPSPRRIRPMQYEVAPSPTREHYRRIEANAYRRFAALSERYRDWVADAPGQAEPFAVVVPTKVKARRGAPVLYDDEDAPLACGRADDPAAAAVLDRLSAPVPRWIAGRLVDARGSLLLVPCAVGAPDGDAIRLHRLR